jgi:hypothetical protein
MADSSQSDPRKAYVVTVVGKVYRDFLVFADTVEHANEIMRGDRREAEAMDDSYEESHTWRARRCPSEDR